MAKARPTYAKRMKELSQMERKREKAERRARRKEERPEKADDIAHIQPGPQPSREDLEETFDGLF